MKIKLSQIAYARSGDKGANANIGVIAHSKEGYIFLESILTKDRIWNYFKNMGIKEVDRYLLQNLWAINFVLKGILGKGGSSSLKLDAQGKALGQALLEMEIDIEEDIFRKIHEAHNHT